MDAITTISEHQSHAFKFQTEQQLKHYGKQQNKEESEKLQLLINVSDINTLSTLYV